MLLQWVPLCSHLCPEEKAAAEKAAAEKAKADKAAAETLAQMLCVAKS